MGKRLRIAAAAGALAAIGAFAGLSGRAAQPAPTPPLPTATSTAAPTTVLTFAPSLTAPTATPVEPTPEPAQEPAAVEELAEENIPVTFCGTNVELFRSLYPEEYANIAAYSDGTIDCVVGSAPPGARILDVPYLNQCSFPDRETGIDVINPCGAGCGPTALEMAIQYAGYTGDRDYPFYALWQTLWTGSRSGTSVESMERVARQLGVYGGASSSMSRNEVRRHINLGHVILMNVKSDPGGGSPYAAERTNGWAPPTTGHWTLITGYSDEGVIMHDPYTDTEERARQNGKNLLVTWETLTQRIYNRQTPMIGIVPLDAKISPPVPTGEDALFEYHPVAWPERLTNGFGDSVPWQRQSFHTGNDYIGALGDPIYAVADGTVVGVGCIRCTVPELARTGYGLTITVDLGEVDGRRLYATYAHLSASQVQPGNVVSAGDLIGLMGNTGYASGPNVFHLHFEVDTRNPFDNPREPFGALDPEPFFSP